MISVQKITKYIKIILNKMNDELTVRVLPLQKSSFVTKSGVTLFKYVCFSGVDIIEFYSDKELPLVVANLNVDKDGTDIIFRTSVFGGKLRLSFKEVKGHKAL